MLSLAYVVKQHIVNVKSQGSIPVPVADGGCSLSGKVFDCESKEQGSNPAAHPIKAYSLTDKNTALRTQR